MSRTKFSAVLHVLSAGLIHLSIGCSSVCRQDGRAEQPLGRRGAPVESTVCMKMFLFRTSFDVVWRDHKGRGGSKGSGVIDKTPDPFDRSLMVELNSGIEPVTTGTRFNAVVNNAGWNAI